MLATTPCPIMPTLSCLPLVSCLARQVSAAGFKSMLMTKRDQFADQVKAAAYSGVAFGMTVAVDEDGEVGQADDSCQAQGGRESSLSTFHSCVVCGACVVRACGANSPAFPVCVCEGDVCHARGWVRPVRCSRQCTTVGLFCTLYRLNCLLRMEPNYRSPPDRLPG